MLLLTELFGKRNELEQIIEIHYANLESAKRTLSTERIPNRNEIIPVLGSIKEMASALAEFLESLNKVLNNPESKTELEKIPFLEAMPNYEIVKNLIAPRHLLTPLSNAFFHNQTKTSLLWEETFELTIWYSECQNILVALPSVIKQYASIQDNWAWNWLQKFYSDQKIKTLRDISERAYFLETTDESELEKGSSLWWCQKLDSYPRTNGYYHLFFSFLDTCPDPSNPAVIEHLKELSILNNMDDDSYNKEQQEIIRQKARALLHQ